MTLITLTLNCKMRMLKESNILILILSRPLFTKCHVSHTSRKCHTYRNALKYPTYKYCSVFLVKNLTDFVQRFLRPFNSKNSNNPKTSRSNKSRTRYNWVWGWCYLYDSGQLLIEICQFNRHRV